MKAIKPEKIIHDEQKFSGRLFNVHVQQVALADGRTARRDVILKEAAVTIVPITKNREVRLVRQYRAPLEDWIIELPAGGLEPGEVPAVAAQRELLEETGDRSEHWHELHGIYATPGICNEFLHIFLATDLIPGPNQLESDEHIEVLTVPFADAIDMIKQHQIDDAKTVAGLMAAGLHLGWLGVNV